jgi:hypothetical protein
MTIIKRILLYLLVLGILYFGLFNQKYPFILFGDFLLFGFLLFIWVLMPVVKSNNIISDLKAAAYFKDYRLPKLLLFTFLVVVSFMKIGIASTDQVQVILFFILKLIVSIFIELLLVFRLLIDDITFPLD